MGSLRLIYLCGYVCRTRVCIIARKSKQHQYATDPFLVAGVLRGGRTMLKQRPVASSYYKWDMEARQIITAPNRPGHGDTRNKIIQNLVVTPTKAHRHSEPLSIQNIKGHIKPSYELTLKVQAKSFESSLIP